MTTTNDKPVQTPNPQGQDQAKQPIAGGTADRKPASDENEENKVKDPTTTGNTTKQPTDPNNPKATTTSEQSKVDQKA